MAGAGYKLFNTGDVLTAAQVNTYLQEQTVMVFASAAARTTALTGVVAEGMISYLTDTDVVQYYNGTTWTTINTDQTPLTTKGDLFTFSTQDARLAVGNNGETLVADSSASTGLRWQGDYAAGKNAIINGDFRINQRGFSSTTTNGEYGFDRWTNGLTAGGGTVTFSAQTFTAGAAPVAGYEAINFYRCVTSGQANADSRAHFRQNIESVRTFANQTVTISFWAKAASGTPSLNVEILQVFGSGGSSQVSTPATKQTIGTSWARYSWTVAVPSISGKTVGSSGDMLRLNIWTSAGSDNATASGTLGIQNNTFDIWGVQVEAGNVATAFQTATGTLAGELAACQRYYFRANSASAWPKVISAGGAYYSTTACYAPVPMPVEMRTAPTLTTGTVGSFSIFSNGSGRACTAIALGNATPNLALLNCTTAAATAGNAGWLETQSSTNAFLEFSSEL